MDKILDNSELKNCPFCGTLNETFIETNYLNKQPRMDGNMKHSPNELVNIVSEINKLYENYSDRVLLARYRNLNLKKIIKDKKNIWGASNHWGEDFSYESLVRIKNLILNDIDVYKDRIKNEEKFNSLDEKVKRILKNDYDFYIDRLMH